MDRRGPHRARGTAPPVSANDTFKDLVASWEQQKRVLDTANKMVKEARLSLAAIENRMIETMDAMQTMIAATETRHVSIQPKTVTRSIDWDQVHEHIRETGAFDLVQRRINVRSAEERAEAGMPVPGIELGTIPVLRITKR